MKNSTSKLIEKYFNPQNSFLNTGEYIVSENIKEIGKDKFFYIRTYGCQSNVRDAETIAGIMRKIKYTQTDKPQKADFIILNTCAIRERAEEKVFGEIGLIQKLRREKPNLTLAICGCMTQEPHVVKKLQNSTWGVDIIFGTNNIHELPNLIESNLFLKFPVLSNYIDGDFIAENLPTSRNSSIKAFVNVMFGCSNYCTFCIVPFTRGKERSRKLSDIIDEVNDLIKLGYKEITLLGQNVNNYGLDLEPRQSFVQLLKAVAETEIERIHFVTSNPWNFDHDIIEVIKKYDNIMPFFHLPIQSGNNEILAKMNREMSIEEYKTIIDKIRKEIPGASISTDIIVGFPNESDAAFQDTLDLYDYCKYDNAYTFIYSKRKNTVAADWSDSIDLKTKKARLVKLNEKVRYYAKQSNLKMLDTFQKVLVGTISKTDVTKVSGYTENWKTVNFRGNKKLIGKNVLVKIIQAARFSLEGELIKVLD